MGEVLESVNRYCSVDKADYSACLDQIDHEYEVNGMVAELRFHYVKFDGNGKPMIKALAEKLSDYIVDYCIATKHRPDDLSTSQLTSLVKKARNLFINPVITEESPDTTGEAGEILLFFLMESVIGAPQVVCKMGLKTNPRKEINGSDGVHAKYNTEDELVDFYFGESKLYASSADAIREAIGSVESFHTSNMIDYELNMVTHHFKYADEKVKKEIEKLIVSGQPGPNARVNYNCLIGYDFKDFEGLQGGGEKRNRK